MAFSGRLHVTFIVSCLLLNGCQIGSTGPTPAIEFSKIPLVDEGGAGKMSVIEGRVIGARPGQLIILFARSGAWYIQPFTDQPFTKIQPDSTWKSPTHLGTEYAALLVESGYRPPTRTDVLPSRGGGVIAVAVAPGEVRMLLPVFWQTWWFRLMGGLAGLLALLAFHRIRLRKLSHELNARFDERFEERARIAQNLHDTLLQGFISASMQLYIAVEQLPENSPTKSRLNDVQQLISRVIEEGRTTLHGLHDITTDSLDLEQAFSRIPLEFENRNQLGEKVRYRVTVKGKSRPLHPLIRDEIYRVGREAVFNAFHKSRIKNIGVDLKYSFRYIRITIHDDGHAMKSEEAGDSPENSAELTRLAERAGKIGARLKVGSRAAGTNVELSIPARVAYLNQFSMRWPKWFVRGRKDGM